MSNRKAPSERQNRNTRDIGLVQLAQRGGAPPAPKVGGKPMLASVVADWETFWRSDVAGAVTDADMSDLVRLFTMYDMRERMMRAYMRKPFTTGSTGQVVVHPAAKEIASLDQRINSLAPAFGRTPAGRLALGIALGAAAKSLEQLNEQFDRDDDAAAESDADPRVHVIDATAAG